MVGARIPGSVDAVEEGVTGTLVPPLDSACLHDAIRRYLDDEALRERHGRAGRERVLRDFPQEPIWKGLHDEYVRLVAEHGAT